MEFENGKTVKCTKDHKFFTRNRGWIKADELTEDDDIRDVQMCVYKAFNTVTKKYYIGKTTLGLEKELYLIEEIMRKEKIRFLSIWILKIW